LIRVAAPGEENADTRQKGAVSSLDVRGRKIVETFAQARLLVLLSTRPNEEHTVEIAHEAPLRGWQRFQNWINRELL
jgi:hypothetical protein